MGFFKNRSIYLYLLIYFVIALVISIVLFRGGNVAGGGESGIPFYDVQRLYEITKDSWRDIFLGVSTGHTVSSTYFWGFLGLFQFLGISGFILQFAFSFFVVFLTLFSMHKMAELFFPSKSGMTGFFSALFYQFNLFNIMNIWNRFQPNVMLFYSVFPLLIFIFYSGLKKKNYVYSIYFGFATALLAYAFSGPAQVIIFWVTIVLFSLYHFLFIKKEVFTLKYFFTTILIWILLNFWWISQEVYFRFSPAYDIVSTDFFSTAGNQNTLDSLSRNLGKLTNVLLMKHGDFFSTWKGYPFDWPHFYNNFLSLILQWLILVYLLYFSIKNINKVWVFFFLSFFCLSVFLSKGNSPPLGEIFNFIFKNVSLFQFFRNPFEKFGILLPLSLSPLFGTSISKMVSRRRVVWEKVILFLFLFYIVVLQGFPFWTGLVYTSGLPPASNPDIGYQVKVPEYYKTANSWLEKNNINFRFITFPIGGEGIYYEWPRGYVGIEESTLLFTTPNLSYSTTGIPYLSVITKSLEELLLKHEDFYKVASILNVKYLLFRPDINYRNSRMRDPDYIDRLLKMRVKNNNNLKLANQFGPLKVYEFQDDIILPKIYAANNLINTSNNSGLSPFLLMDTLIGDITYNSVPDLNGKLQDFTYSYYVKNNAIYYLNKSSYPSHTDAPYIFPYISRSPDSKLFPVVLLKEKLQELFLSDQESKINWKILMLGKRIMEAKVAAEQGETDSALRALRLYEIRLPVVLDEFDGLSKSLKLPNERVWKEKTMETIFNSHLYILNELEKKDFNSNGAITNLKNNFLRNMSKYKILPLYTPIINQTFPLNDRVVYSVNVNSQGFYDLYLPKTNFFPAYFNLKEELTIQIDDELTKGFLDTSGRNIYLGKFYFDEGYHEISFNQSPNINIIDENKSEFVLDSEGVKELRFPVDPYDPYSHYYINFNYLIKYGSGLNFNVSLNNDKLIESDDSIFEEYFNSSRLTPEDYFFGEKSYTTPIFPNSSSDKMELIFEVEHWNNCFKVFFQDPSKCSDPVTYKSFDKPTKVEVSNLSLYPGYSTELFLIKKQSRLEYELPIVKTRKINNTRYFVSVENSNIPFILVFSELYDNGWKLKLNNEANYYPEANHFLVNNYANAWYLDKEGNYDLIIEYWPQKLLSVGKLTTVIFAVTGVIFLIYHIVKNKKHDKNN